MSYENENITHTGEHRYLSATEVLEHMDHLISPPIFLEFNADTFHSKVNIPDNDVKKALLLLTKQHPFLRSTITPSTDLDYFFEPLDIPETEDNGDWMQFSTMEVDDVTKWVDIVADLTKEPWTNFDQLWKVVWLKQKHQTSHHAYTLITIFHHAIMDAKGALDLIARQFLPKLCMLLQGEELDTKSLQLFHLTKSAEEIFYGIHGPLSKQPIRWYIKPMIEFLLWKQKIFRKNGPEYKPKIRATEEPISDPQKLGAGHHPFVVEESLSKAFIEVCKEQNSTVHGMLLVILSSALEKTRLEFPALKDQIVKFLFPVDLRKFNLQLKTTPLPCGTFTTMEEQNIPPIKKDDLSTYYNIARKVTAKIREQNKINDRAVMLAEFVHQFLGNKKLSLLDRLRSLINDCTMFTNIGKFETDEKQNKSPIQLAEHHFGISTIPDYTIVISLTTIDSKMCFCIGYNRNWITEEFAKVFENKIKNLINFCVQKLPSDY